MNPSLTAEAAAERPLVLLGCGVLRKEVDALIAKNGWPLETRYLPTGLHNDLTRLGRALENALRSSPRRGEDPIVLYGACHPLMDKMLERHGTYRTAGQNCIVQLLGEERFMAELSAGAYFLLEDWAVGRRSLISAEDGPLAGAVREIFRCCHRYLLGVRTPCSGDFTADAEAVARLVDLPLRWTDVGLEHLESVLAQALERKLRARGA